MTNSAKLISCECHQCFPDCQIKTWQMLPFQGVLGVLHKLVSTWFMTSFGCGMSKDLLIWFSVGRPECMVITSSEPCSGILHLETPWLLTLATESLWPSKASNRRPGPRGTQPRSSSLLSSQGSLGWRGQSQTFKTAGTGWPAELFSRHALFFVSLPFNPKHSSWNSGYISLFIVTYYVTPILFISFRNPFLITRQRLSQVRNF